jgi:hypothetical protein
MVNGFDAFCLLTTLMLSMINMVSVPVAAMPCIVMIVIVFKALWEVGPDNAQAAVVHPCICGL